MLNIKKYLTKDMTKEFEDTILSDTQQQNKLYDKIEELKEIINNKDIEIKNLNEDIKLLKDKNNILENLITKNNNIEVNIEDFHGNNEETSSNLKHTITNLKNNTNIKNDIDIKKTDEYISLKDKYDELVYEKDHKEDDSYKNQEEITNLNETINKLTNKINDLNNKEINIEEIENKYKKIYEDKLKEEKKTKPNTRCRNKELDILTRYPVIIYKNINDNEVKEMVAAENSYIINYQNEISNKTNKKENDISLDDIINYIVEQEGLSQQDTSRLKNKFERCKYLQDTYQDKLRIFKFDINMLSHMVDNDWKLWLESFHGLIKNEFPNEVTDTAVYDTCKHILQKGSRKGEQCGKLICRIKSHKKTH